MTNIIKITADSLKNFFNDASDKDQALAAAQVAQSNISIAANVAEAQGTNPNSIKVMEHTYYEGPGCSNTASALTSHLLKGEYQPCVKKKSYYLAKIGQPNKPVSEVVNDPSQLEVKKSDASSDERWAKESNSLNLNKTPKEYQKYLAEQSKKAGLSVEVYAQKNFLLNADEFTKYYDSFK